MSSGPATTRTATTNASRSSGKLHRDQRFRLGREPITIDETTEEAREPSDDDHRDREITNQRPPTLQQRVRDDRARQDERTQRGRHARAPAPTRAP